jgi:hypothetical protein
MKAAAFIFSAAPLLPGLHSRTDVIEFCLMMLVGVAVMGLLFRKVWRRYTPKGFAFFCLAMGAMGLAVSTSAVATAPSSATRITVEGYCSDFRQVYVGRVAEYDFRLISNAGSVLQLQTPLTPPWIEDGTRLRVTYLDETRPGYEFPRAIGLTVLSGDHMGWHGSVDANWFGAWLLFPIGIACPLQACFMRFETAG